MTTPAADIANLLHHWLAYRRVHDRSPGLVSVVTVDGERVLDAGFGVANIEQRRPVNSDTIFRIASITKVFTSVAVMQLVERGEMRLDTPVSNYLDWFRADDDRIARITPRHLLTHTAGLMRDGNTDHQQSRVFPDVEGLQRDLREGVVTFAPNDHFKYSNYGLAVLGQLVAAVSGMSFAEYQTANIFEPVGMSRTSVDWPPVEMSNVATGYSREIPTPRQPSPAFSLAAYAPAFGMCSTANDLTRFMSAVLDGDALLNAESKREMMRTHWANGPGDVTWGLGFRILKVDDRRIVCSSGKFEGFHSMIAIDPERQITAVVLMNATGSATPIGSGVIHATNKAIDLATHKPDGADLSRYTGLFTALWGESLIAPIGPHLYEFDPSADRIFDEPNELTLVDSETARVDTARWNGCLGESIRFHFDENGRATSATIDGVTSNRWFPDS